MTERADVPGPNEQDSTGPEPHVTAVAQYWEAVGFSHAAGIILGHLMTCEPAALTQAQLARELQLSAGSVSTQLKALVTMGLVEKVREQGSRSARYQLPVNVWSAVIGSEQSRIAGLRVIADAALAARPQTRTDRVESLDTVVRFFEQEWPHVLARYADFEREEFQRKERP
ncbi:MarR family transcriptional regulator [Demequina sp. B12]|uniref:GbsR/MarR family transcriptional regulator n=1 Tax=Demequina sp. B12 TaxID=2992757 RepID=UPI00237B228B|nr:helix-turn-helix domain-containing protein [Demequina sp. B12]MDE0571861.1 MarR family transcriptional regulator [Demequina sp. B12]